MATARRGIDLAGSLDAPGDTLSRGRQPGREIARAEPGALHEAPPDLRRHPEGIPIQI